MTVHFPPPHAGKEVLDEFLSEVEMNVELYTEENRKRLERALRRVRFCSFLRGLNFTYRELLDDRRGHYSWCPYSKWIDGAIPEHVWHRDLEIWNALPEKIIYSEDFPSQKTLRKRKILKKFDKVLKFMHNRIDSSKRWILHK